MNDLLTDNKNYTTRDVDNLAAPAPEWVKALSREVVFSYLDDVADLDDVEAAIYTRLVMVLYVRKGKTPASISAFAKALGCHPNRFRKIVLSLIDKGLIHGSLEHVKVVYLEDVIAEQMAAQRAQEDVIAARRRGAEITNEKRRSGTKTTPNTPPSNPPRHSQTLGGCLDSNPPVYGENGIAERDAEREHQTLGESLGGCSAPKAPVYGKNGNAERCPKNGQNGVGDLSYFSSLNFNNSNKSPTPKSESGAARLSPRSRGTNSRSQGTNPRSTKTNPRALRAAQTNSRSQGADAMFVDPWVAERLQPDGAGGSRPTELFVTELAEECGYPEKQVRLWITAAQAYLRCNATIGVITQIRGAVASHAAKTLTMERNYDRAVERNGAAKKVNNDLTTFKLSDYI